MIQSIAIIKILGLPLFAWFGILAFLSFFFTSLIAVLNQKGIHKIPFSWHPRLAKIAFVFAAIHFILALSLYL